MHLICPQCLAVNRVPAERFGDRPKCGKCSTALLGGEVVALNAASFAKFAGSGDLPLLVDCWAAWCGPCKMMAPVFAQVAQEMATQVRFAKLDTEAEPQLAQRYGIRSIPTLLLFKNGVEAARISGAMDAGSLKRWLAGCV